MALALQGTVLTQTAPLFVAEAFCRARPTDRLGSVYALAGDVAADALIERAMPMV
jgi:hypothetical protein